VGEAAVERCRAARSARTDGYARHRPEETLLYRVVSAHWPAFHARAEERGGLPKFVVREVEGYLGCGLLERGLVHLACRACGEPMVVAFSCKKRGLCPSCVGRRMADVAAHLCDEVLPEVPIRQWVCSLPWRLRYPLGYDRRLCAEVLGAFTGALDRSLRRRAKRELGVTRARDARTGAVTFVQRADSALRLNPHFHALALDGVYVRGEGGALEFRALDAPSADDVAEVAARTHARLVKILDRHGRSLEGLDDVEDALRADEPVLASCYSASASDQQLFGDDAGQRTRKLVGPVGLASATRSRSLVADVGGVNVHAEVAVDGRDRAKLERLCRYVARPMVCQERLSERADGRLEYALKKVWKDGTRAVVLEPFDLLARVCALVPPPRFHLLRHQRARACWRAGRLERERQRAREGRGEVLLPAISGE
jgi:hypothetical protein